MWWSAACTEEPLRRHNSAHRDCCSHFTLICLSGQTNWKRVLQHNVHSSSIYSSHDLETTIMSPGEGNGTPLQCSGLENSMDGGAWWAAVHGVTKSQTWLSDFTFFFSIVSFGGGNGNPLQYSCLENPMDRGAWWAAVYGVAKSWTRLSN